MLDATVTHYFPWDESDAFAWCGAAMIHPGQHSLEPTCATCAAMLAAADARAEADEAIDAIDDATEVALEPVVVAEPAPMSPLGVQLFAFAITLNRVAAAAVKGGRR